MAADLAQDHAVARAQAQGRRAQAAQKNSRRNKPWHRNKLAPVPSGGRTPLLYGTVAVAELLSVSRVKVYELIKSGRLIARKNDKATVVLHTDLLAYVHSLPIAVLK